MSTEANKALAQRLIDGFNSGNLDVLIELSATDFVNHAAPPGMPTTREGWKEVATMFRTAFPDMHVHVDDMIAEGDQVVMRYTGSGTHQGELMGIPPTNKAVTITGILIGRIRDGKFVERWDEVDMLGMMQQLGAISSSS